MTWSEVDIEEKKGEENANARAANPAKIVTEDKFKGLSPGRLHLRVGYSGGSLKVHIQGAEDLYGKKSQDPYGLAYLLSKDGKAYFQRGNTCTDTFSRNLDPPFNHTFSFKMSMNEVVSKSLVFAIWDKDTKSRDDFMAGVRISLRDVQYFKKDYSVNIEMQHQEMDGHPAAFHEDDIRSLFKWEMPVMGSSMDLKTCNNHLVAFIERARVLAEAYDFKSNLPDSLTNTVSVMPPDVREMFRTEIMRYEGKMNSIRAERAKVEAERDNLRFDNEGLKAEKMKKMDLLASRRQEHYELGVVHAELEAKCGNVSYLQEKIELIEENIRLEQQRQRTSVGAVPDLNIGVSQANFQESSRDMPSFGMAGRGDTSSQSLSQDYEIRVRTEYEQRIRESLDKKRGQYKVQYEDFLVNLERDAAEIIRLYEDILREKFNPRRLDGLRGIWDKRGYQARIEMLMGDLEELRRKIQIRGQEEDKVKKWYEDELARLEAKLQLLMKNLRDLFSRFTEFTSARYSEFSEISIYNQLLDYEDQRLSAPRSKVEVKVRKSTSRNTHSSQARARTSTNRRVTGESGYSSPMKTPDGTLDRGETYTHEQSARYSQEGRVSSSSTRHSRTSRSSTNSMKSDTLERIKHDVV